jgi:hypothetical protein
VVAQNRTKTGGILLLLLSLEVNALKLFHERYQHTKLSWTHLAICRSQKSMGATKADRRKAYMRGKARLTDNCAIEDAGVEWYGA